MDWRYQQFEREAVFPEERERVLEGTRAFVTTSLAGWQVTDTADGIQITGQCGGHRAKGIFRIETVSGGTKVIIALLVERAGPLGFLLFDVGGYYNGQMFHWLEGIQRQLLRARSDFAAQGVAAPAAQPPLLPKASSRLANCFAGCALLSVFCLVAFYGITAVVGLVTGHYSLFGRHGETLHGPWARIFSAFILTLIALLFYSVGRKRRNARD